jgi:beta-N-acetylhexosaminidase
VGAALRVCYPLGSVSERAIEVDAGQVLWVGFDGAAAPADLLERIARGHVGAVVLFARNLATTAPVAGAVGTSPSSPEIDLARVAELVRSLHGAGIGDCRPLVAIDQEGGRVQRIRAPATNWPPMLGLSRIEDRREANRLAFLIGDALGSELAALGIDVDFAPVLDVHTNPDNPIIGDRAFACEPERAAELALAFSRGLARARILSCGKHFPGHGDTAVDSHLELPRIDHPRDRLDRIELLPFHRAAEVKLPMIMTAHVVFAAVDAERPATLSPAVIQGVLRNQLGYSGVVVSDDLDMKAIRNHYEAGEAAVAAVAAGCDALLMCQDGEAQAEARAALVDRAARDDEFRRRLGSAADAVRALKRTRIGLLRDGNAQTEDMGVIGRESHQRLAQRAGAAGPNRAT